MDYEDYIPKIKIFFLALVSWIFLYHTYFILFRNEKYIALFADPATTEVGKLMLIILLPFQGL